MSGYLDPGEPVIERMKPVAAAAPSVVGARDAAGFSGLAGRAPDRRHLLAVVALLAESADPDLLMIVTGRKVPLRPGEAHRAYARCKQDGIQPPPDVAEGERYYQVLRKRLQRARLKQAGQ